MLHEQAGISPGKWDAQSSLGFWDTNSLTNFGETIRPNYIHKKRESAEQWLWRPVVHWVKLKESEKRNKYLDTAR